MSGYAREWIKGKTVSHEESRDTLKGFPIYPAVRFQRENIAYRRRPRRRHPECIYDVSHFLWRAGAFAANKKRTREKWRERAWATPRAKRKVKAGKGERHRSFVMSKSIVLAALAEESLISKWGGILLPPPSCPPIWLCRCRAAFYPDEESTWYQTGWHDRKGGGGRRGGEP